MKRWKSIGDIGKKVITPLIIVIMSVMIAIGFADKFNNEFLSRFQHESQHEVNLAILKLDNYQDLLYMGRSYVALNDLTSIKEWQTFYADQSAFKRYPGVSAISYVSNVPTAEVPAFKAKMKQPAFFGPAFELKNISSRDEHGYVSAYISSNDIRSVEGLDLLEKNDRYEVYSQTLAKREIVASPTFMLATGHRGFFTVLPVYKQDRVDGFVLVSFRINEVMSELFEDSHLGYKVTDVTDDGSTLLYQSKTWENGGYQRSQVIYVGGRSWNVQTSGQPERRPLGLFLPAMIVVVGIVLATGLFRSAIRVK